jgi:hypothetical protein
MYRDVTYCSYYNCPVGKECFRYLAKEVWEEFKNEIFSIGDFEKSCETLNEWRKENEKNRADTSRQ